jgi:hypothetical protein
MRKKKPTKKSTAKKSSARPKKIARRKNQNQRKKTTHPKISRGTSSAQIHQGVGSGTANQLETPPEIPEDAAEYGGES